MRALLLPLVLGLLACGDDGGAAVTEPDGTYTVRGVIQEMGESSIAIHHETIEDFANRDGDVVGMDSMTMMFHRPADVSVEGIENGDPVEVTFDVRWNGDHTLTLTALRELPAGTELELSAGHH